MKNLEKIILKKKRFFLYRMKNQMLQFCKTEDSNHYRKLESQQEQERARESKETQERGGSKRGTETVGERKNE